MKFNRFLSIILSLVLVFSFSVTVFATEVDETLPTENNIEQIIDPADNEIDSADNSVSIDLTETNAILSVIQSQLWIILVVGLIYFVYKFFRIFF